MGSSPGDRQGGGKIAGDMEQPFRSGFVAILGRPNVGKSTLVNRLVGHKVSIVTSRPQTTRTRVLGIVNRPDAQLVLIDTPGMHKDGSALGRQMSSEIAQALEGIDLLAVMIDAPRGVTPADRLVFERATRCSGPVGAAAEQDRRACPSRRCCRCWKLARKRRHSRR